MLMEVKARQEMGSKVWSSIKGRPPPQPLARGRPLLYLEWSFSHPVSDRSLGGG